MRKKLKIILKEYENDKFKQENSCILDFGDSKIVRKFLFLTLSPILLYLNLLYCFFYFLKYFFEFILKAKNKLISIFNKK